MTFPFPKTLDDVSPLRAKRIARDIDVSRCRVTTKDVAYIRTSNHPWELISEGDLLEIFSGRRIQKLFLSPKGHRASPSSSEKIPLVLDCGKDIEILLAAVAKIDPEIIYLQASPHTKTDSLILDILDQFPNTKLAVEYYDVSALFSDRFLTEQGYAVDEIHRSRMACRAAFERADLIVHKQGGDEWDFLTKSFRARTVQWFPVVGSNGFSGIERTPIGQRKRVIYAGSIWSHLPITGAVVDKGNVLLAALSSLISAPNFDVHVYNASHRSPLDDENPKFRNLAEWLTASGATYHQSIDLSDLRNVFVDAHFGLAALPNIKDVNEPLVRSGFGNRALTPLSYGVPVIVTSQEAFMGDTIGGSGAGIVFSAFEPEKVGALAQHANYETARQSAATLARQLIDQNRASKALIRDFFNV